MKDGREEWNARVAALAAETERARASGDRREFASALRRLADVERRPPWGRADAQAHYEEAIELLRGHDEPLELSHAIRHLGIVHEDEGRLEKAEAAYDEALAIYRTAAERGSELDHANALRYPAAIKWQLNKPEEAAPLWEEACERYERAGIAEGVVEAAGRLALMERRELLARLVALALLGRPRVLRCCVQRPARAALQELLGHAAYEALRTRSGGTAVPADVAAWAPLAWAWVGYRELLAAHAWPHRGVRRLARLGLPASRTDAPPASRVPRPTTPAVQRLAELDNLFPRDPAC
jgi:tetratricopeptide (TPR) repeat protein